MKQIRLFEWVCALSILTSGIVIGGTVAAHAARAQEDTKPLGDPGWFTTTNIVPTFAQSGSCVKQKDENVFVCTPGARMIYVIRQEYVTCAFLQYLDDGRWVEVEGGRLYCWGKVMKIPPHCGGTNTDDYACSQAKGGKS